MAGWADKCAERLERTLNKRPRHPKTRQYLKSLPKRDKARVDPMEFMRLKLHPERTLTITITPAVRGKKHRLTPGARKRRGIRNCRPNGRECVAPAVYRATRRSRDLETCRRHRETLFAVQAGQCGICGKPMRFEPQRGSLDHVIPLSLGGVEGLGNLILAHGECNGEKTNDIPTGCELVWLLAVNARLGVPPLRF